MNGPERPVAKLTVTYQDKTLSIWELPKGASRIIGRGAEVHYQIKSGILSRRHCEIKDTGNGIEIKDLGSLNGILVNRERVTCSKLKNGDEVQLGPIVIKIEVIADQKQAAAKSPAVSAESLKKDNNIDDGFPPWDVDLPSGRCIECGKPLYPNDLASHLGVFNAEQIYCISCFCEGAGDFPTIAGYRIVKKIGRGGMGEVYEAVQLSMERPVAFKLMKGLQAAKPNQLKRFFREARIGGKLTHPNIVGFIDSGQFENGYFITMEFIYGRDVKYLIKRHGCLEYNEALRIGYYVASALEYAQSRYQIVHRDVKPGNILVDRDRMVKLTDFGLSKSLEDLGLSSITRTKTGVGTVYYMAPEQILDSRTVDHRVDIYALGVSLYEMLAGVRPYVADQIVTLVHKIQEAKPLPLTELIPELPPKIWALIAKAMAKKPEQRYQSAGEMKEELRTLLKTLGHEFQ